MKKTYPANVNGRIFYIDEDAYSLLQNYLHQLHVTFGGEEGREIVGDIEARIAELFDERIAEGASVITLADVNRVIETMGRPEDLSEGNAAPEDKAPEEPREQKPFVTFNLPGKKRLFRNMQNRVFGGVVSGLGTYLGWDISIMRFAVVLLALFTYAWPVTVIYLIAWMVIPPARTTKQILEMYGEPINVETVGQTILNGQPTPPPFAGGSKEDMDARARELGKKDKSDFFSTLVRVCANLVMGFLGLLGAVCGLAFVAGIIAIIAAMTASMFTPEIPMLANLPYTSPYLVCMTALAALAFLLIPCIGVVWGAASMIFNAPAAGKKIVISLVVLDMIFLALTIALAVALTATVV